MPRNERETCMELIEPLLAHVGWEWEKERSISPGRLYESGKFACDGTKAIVVDYVLQYRGVPLVVLEVKRESERARDAMRQATLYAQRLLLRFSLATNGTDWILTDNDTGDFDTSNSPPSPTDIVERLGATIDWDLWGVDAFRILRLLGREVKPYDACVAIAALIFLRWADFQEAEREAIAASEQTGYSPVLPKELHWRSWHETDVPGLESLFEVRLPEFLASLSDGQHDLLRTQLHRISDGVEILGRLPITSIRQLIAWLADQPFETASDRRELRKHLDGMIELALDNRQAGQFRTPSTIADLLVELGAPKSGDRVYDPCFGTAGLLTAACERVMSPKKDGELRSGHAELTIAGVEQNSGAYVIALARLVLSGVVEPLLEFGNALECTPSDQRNGFDVVLANPPLGMRVDPEGLAHYPVRSRDATALFIQHAVSQLNPNGRAVIVVPQGILSRGGPDQRLRQMLLEQATIEAVVSLPDSVFMPFTSVRACILVIRRSGPTKRIRMVEADSYFVTGKGRAPSTIRLDLSKQLGEKVRLPTPTKNCWDVDLETLEKVEWDLTPRRRDQSGLFEALASLRGDFQMTSLEACCHIFSGRSIRSKELLDQPPSAEQNRILEAEIDSVWKSTRVEIEVVSRELLETQDRLTKARHQLEEREQSDDRLASAHFERTKVRADLDRLREVEASTENRSARLTVRLQKLHEQATHLQAIEAEWRALQAEVEHLKSSSERRGDSVRIRHEQMQSLKSRVDDLEGVESQLDECLSDIEQLKRVESDSTARRAELSRSLAALEAECEYLEQRKIERKRLALEVEDLVAREHHLQVRRNQYEAILAGLPLDRESQPHPLPGALQDELVVPFIRAGDLRDGEASQASRAASWLSREAVDSIDPDWKLKSCDLLLPKSGAVGKAAIVHNGAVGGVAAYDLFVIRPEQDRLDPYFLLAFLNAAKCRAWFEERTRGATVRHLPRKIVESLLIPLPPIQLQQQIGQGYRANGVDAIEHLVQLSGGHKSDPVVQWLDVALAEMPNVAEKISNPLDLSTLDRFASELRPIRNQIAHEESSENSLASWVMALNEALRGLIGAQHLPIGPGLLSVLQDASQSVRLAEEAIRGHLPSEARARDLNKIVLGRVNKAIARLRRESKLVFRTMAGSLPSGESTEIRFAVINESYLPLRNVRVNSPTSEYRFPYFREGAEQEVKLTVNSPVTLGRFSLRIQWSAQTLDGQPVNGSRELAFDVVETEVAPSTPEDVELGGSPYVCGDPLRPERKDVFKGREEQLKQIERQIIQSGNVVLLEGNRRAGKSSILWHLEGPDAVPGWLGVYCSLQGAEGSRDGQGVPTVEIFREMAQSIAKSLQKLGADTPLPDGSILPPGKKLGIAKACREGISEEASFSDFRDYVELALAELESRELGLLLMLDEFDKIQEGIDRKITSPQVPENIRFLVQTYPRFSAILTGSRRLKRLREEYWSALYGIGTRFGVTALSPESARDLITEPVKGRLTYSREAVDKVISITSRQPYLVQCLCNRIFDMAAQLKTQSVTLDLVNRASTILIDDNEHFASLWDYVQSDRCRFILSLCHWESEGPDPLRLGVLQEKLLENGLEVDEDTLIAELDHLQELELIDLVSEVGGGHYVLAIPMMGSWIQLHKDFAVVQSKAKSEMGNINE